MDLFGKEVLRYVYTCLYIVDYERSLLQEQKDLLFLVRKETENGWWIRRATAAKLYLLLLCSGPSSSNQLNSACPAH